MQHKINEEIKADLVRVIDSEGKHVGVLSLSEALGLAYGNDMDLVLFDENTEPCTCRILNYSKYKFEQNKKQKELKKKNKTVATKEIRLSYNIDNHDLETKVNQIKKFLTKKDKVLVSVIFKGRESMYIDSAYELLDGVKRKCEDLYSSAQLKKINNFTVTLMLAPKK